MGFSQNTVTVSGNLTGDPEMREFPDGGAIVRFGLAWNQSVKDQNTGQWNDVAHFFDVEMRGGVAKSIAGQVRKGTPVSFTGRLMQQRWQDKATGANRSRVIVQAFDAFVGRGKNEGGGGGGMQDDWGAPQPNTPPAQGGYGGAPQGGQWSGPPAGGQQPPQGAPGQRAQGWGAQPPAQQQGPPAGWDGPPAQGPPQQQQRPPATPAEDDLAPSPSSGMT